jgi:hypothetical protein
VCSLAFTEKLRVCSYNCEGFKSSLGALYDICVNIVLLQEIWLHKEELYMLSNLHPCFTGFGSSAMNNDFKFVKVRPFTFISKTHGSTSWLDHCV